MNRLSRTVAIVASLAILVVMTFAWLRIGPRTTPTGQPAMGRLDASHLSRLRDAFNARAGETRLLVMLSPT